MFVVLTMGGHLNIMVDVPVLLIYVSVTSEDVGVVGSTIELIFADGA